MKFWKQRKRTYLDWAAATPLSDRAYSAMRTHLKGNYGNPGAVHQEGDFAKKAVDEARLNIARSLGVRENEIIFTGSGTEANNLAINGLFLSLIDSDKDISDFEIISTRIEHPSILRMLEHLESQGLIVKYVDLDEYGLIDLSNLKSLLNKKTCLVTFAYVNSEIGAIQNVKQISRQVRHFNKQNNVDIKIHLDAAQAPLWLSSKPHQLGVDMMMLDAGKCCGPKGVGVLVKLAKVNLKGTILGGGQESELRSGTENVAGIAGAAVAIVDAQSEHEARAESVSKIRDEGIVYLLEEIPGVVLNGPEGSSRLANNINISIPGLDTEFATVVLDSKGFAVSTKSACAGAGGGESSVVKEISSDSARSMSTLRISLGPDVAIKEIKLLTRVLKEHVSEMKKLTQ